MFTEALPLVRADDGLIRCRAHGVYEDWEVTCTQRVTCNDDRITTIQLAFECGMTLVLNYTNVDLEQAPADELEQLHRLFAWVVQLPPIGGMAARRPSDPTDCAVFIYNRWQQQYAKSRPGAQVRAR